MRIHRYVGFAAALALLACSSSGQRGSGGDGPDGSATIIRGTELSGNLLQSLRNRVPSMTVSERAGECPRVAFRGQRSINHNNPTVYVDGGMTLDTCILSQISATEVDKVEVYPSGNTPYPGMQRNPFGVIVVFRVRE